MKDSSSNPPLSLSSHSSSLLNMRRRRFAKRLESSISEDTDTENDILTCKDDNEGRPFYASSSKTAREGRMVIGTNNLGSFLSRRKLITSPSKSTSSYVSLGDDKERRRSRDRSNKQQRTLPGLVIVNVETPAVDTTCEFSAKCSSISDEDKVIPEHHTLRGICHHSLSLSRQSEHSDLVVDRDLKAPERRGRTNSNGGSSVSSSASDDEDEDSFLPRHYYFSKSGRGASSLSNKCGKATGTLGTNFSPPCALSSGYVEDDGSATASSSESEDTDDSLDRCERNTGTSSPCSLTMKKPINSEDIMSPSLNAVFPQDDSKVITSCSGRYFCDGPIPPPQNERKDYKSMALTMASNSFKGNEQTPSCSSTSSNTLPHRKLKPPPLSSTPPRSRRYRLLQQQGIGDESPFLFSTSSRRTLLSESFHRNLSWSFDTIDSADSDSFSSLFSTISDELNDSSLSFFGRDEEDIEIFVDTPSAAGIEEILILDEVNTSVITDSNNQFSSENSTIPTGLRWSDECGMPLVTIHTVQSVPDETCRVIIVLMNAPIAPYEFLHCEFQTQSRLRVSDILKQLPSLRRQNRNDSSFETSCSRDDHVEIKYSRLYVRGRELINILAIQDYFGVNVVPGDGSTTTSGCHGLLRDGMIFLAIRDGCDVRAVVSEGEALLSNKMLRREIRKARIAGRALRTLRSTEEWTQYENEQLQNEKTLKKLMRRKSKRKPEPHRRSDDSNCLESHTILPDETSLESIGYTNRNGSFTEPINTPSPKTLVVPSSTEGDSLCSSIEDEHYYPWKSGSGTVGHDNVFKSKSPSVFLEETVGVDLGVLKCLNCPATKSNSYGRLELDNDIPEEESKSGRRFRTISFSDSSDLMDDLLETLRHHPQQTDNYFTDHSLSTTATMFNRKDLEDVHTDLNTATSESSTIVDAMLLSLPSSGGSIFVAADTDDDDDDDEEFEELGSLFRAAASCEYGTNNVETNEEDTKKFRRALARSDSSDRIDRLQYNVETQVLL